MISLYHKTRQEYRIRAMKVLSLILGFLLVSFDHATAELPQKVKLSKDVVFTIPASVGDPAVLVEAGTEVKLLKIVGEKLHLEHGVAEVMVSPDCTDIDKNLISKWRESETARLALALAREAEGKAADDNLEKQGITLLMGKVFQSVGMGLIVVLGNGDFVLLRGAPYQPERGNVECLAKDAREMFTYQTVGDAQKSIPVFNWVPSAD